MMVRELENSDLEFEWFLQIRLIMRDYKVLLLYHPDGIVFLSIIPKTGKQQTGQKSYLFDLKGEELLSLLHGGVAAGGYLNRIRLFPVEFQSRMPFR